MSKTFSIGETSKRTQISVKRLRYWQERGYIPAPELTKCGERSYRYYTQEHINFLKLLKENLDEGFTVKAAAEKTKNEFKL